jgi:5'-nucleotidase
MNLGFHILIGNIFNNKDIVNKRNIICFDCYDKWMSETTSENFQYTLRKIIIKKYKPILLIDIDNTLTNFSDDFETEWLKLHPNKYLDYFEYNLYEAVKIHFDKEELCNIQYDIKKVMNTKGLFLNQYPIEGSIEAYHEFIKLGFEVKLCSTPWHTSTICYSEKASWCSKYLGQHKDLILTNDKTLIIGDILIDDHPNICGLAIPQWTQILYSRPYNEKHTGTPRISNWKEYQKVVLNVLFGFINC